MKEQFSVPNNFPKPRKMSVIVKREQQGTQVTDAGIQLLQTAASNAQKPNIGRIYAVGDGVPEDIKPGMRVYYNQYCDLEIMVCGYPYVMLSDTDVYCILNDENYMPAIILDSKEVRRGKKIVEQQDRVKRLAVKEANDKDKRFEGYKKQSRKK